MRFGPATGRLSDRFGPEISVVFGVVIFGLAMFFFSWPAANPAYFV
jgi:MFS family permease